MAGKVGKTVCGIAVIVFAASSWAVSRPTWATQSGITQNVAPIHRAAPVKKSGDGFTAEVVRPTEGPIAKPVSEENTEVVLLKMDDFEKVRQQNESLLRSFDGETFEQREDGLYTLLFLQPEEVIALQQTGAVFVSQGTLADHMVQFAPSKTLQKIQNRLGHLGSYEPLRAQLVSQNKLQLTEEDGKIRSVVDPCADTDIVHLQYDEYHTLQEGTCFLDNLANHYPGIAQKVSIGFSVEGRDIGAMKITGNPAVDESGKEKIFFSGETHAREWATHEMMLYLAEYLTTRYDTDPQVQRIVNNSVVWLVPVVNPDGFEYTWTHERMWRKNRRPGGGGWCDGVDLNRNYNYKWGYDDYGSSGFRCTETYRGPSPASELETQAIQDLLNAQKFSVAVGYHTYSQLVLYPWGWTPFLAPQSYTSLRAMGKKYASLVQAAHGQEYLAGQGSYTIYQTNGEFTDYAYGAHGTLSFCPEMRPNDWSLGGIDLPEDQILANNEENMAAALWLMDNVANAVGVSNPTSDTIIENPTAGDNFFSLPLTPTSQKPDLALGYPTAYMSQLQAWQYYFPGWTSLNPNFGAAGYNNFQPGFEGCGSAGYGYKVVINDPVLQSWADALTSYKVLPYVFEDGADVVLHRNQSVNNVIGIPSRTPVFMQDLRIFRRNTESSGHTWGNREVVLEERTSLEDMNSSHPWIDWDWNYTDSAGTVHHANPTGEHDASLYVNPFLAYQIKIKANNTGGLGGIYLLSFPGSTAFDFADCNYNAVSDGADIADGASSDCNSNRIPDECDIAGRASEDSNGNGIPDECETSSSCRGDTNCDGMISQLDVDPFVKALYGQAAWEQDHPNCPWLNADTNGDGNVTFADIDPLVALLDTQCP